MERVVTVGDSGNDEEMLSGDACAIVVGNYSPELEPLRGFPRIRFVSGKYARGVIEGLDHYDFFGEFKAPVLELAAAGKDRAEAAETEAETETEAEREVETTRA
jgi:sucrose-phosphate synthase